MSPSGCHCIGGASGLARPLIPLRSSSAPCGPCCAAIPPTSSRLGSGSSRSASAAASSANCASSSRSARSTSICAVRSMRRFTSRTSSCLRARARSSAGSMKAYISRGSGCSVMAPESTAVCDAPRERVLIWPMAEPEVLEAPNILEYPYARSVGPIIGRFMAALRDRRFLGIRAKDGHVICPPTEYDPETGEELTPDGLVEVGPAGEVTTWAWVSPPRDQHPLDHPFARALVALHGADTA